MTQFPKIALAAALLAGVGTLALPVTADAKKDAKAAGPAYSPEFIKAAGPAQAAIKGTDVAAMETAVSAAEAAAKTDDDRYAAAHMRVQVQQVSLKSNPQADQSVLAPTLQTLVDNPKTPQAEKSQFYFFLGQFADKKRDFPAALRDYQQASALGYNEPQLPLIIAQTKISAGDVAGGTADFARVVDTAEAAGKPAPEAYYRFALAQNVNTRNKAGSVEWLGRLIAAYPTSKNWHDVLTIYGLQQGSVATPDRGQTIDLFRLMRQTKSLDQYGYEEYGDKVIKVGLPDEARTVIAEGRAAGKIPAGSGNATAIAADAAKGIQSEGSLAPLDARARSGATGSLAAQTADAYLGKGEHAKAIELYRVALGKGGVKVDDVNLHLGIALALSGDKAGAKTAFGAVSGPINADIAHFWTLSLDHPATA
ncbi:hypothetical protein [Sphingomonas bacterium]|uniref:hypothetical protein n=1 Tax=Sphingomonas bacterium TaxID=1895847 RepID=UPI001575DD39|nr:hypothetical protein [Sphingomonas bacterium]